MFDQLTGNERVKQLLRRILTSGRVPGALLFSGPEGVGKKLFALELARALNCRSPQWVEGCGRCSACVRIGKFNYPQSDDTDDWKRIIWTDHPDVGMVVAPKRLLWVEQMRAVEAEANFRPFEGKARFFLIDDAEKLNDPSANALLKVLEEPPRTSHIVLITARPAMLLATIRSRCQAIRFSPLSAAEIEEHLTRNKLVSEEDSHLRARAAAGSLGRALDTDAETYKEQREEMLAVLHNLAIKGDQSALLRSSELLNDARYKDEYETRLELLETLIRDAWLLSLGDGNGLMINDDLRPSLAKIAQRIDSHRVTSWISQIEELREQLVVNINRKPATDALFLSMASV
ncbi:MAG: ATP-binding protein [Pyrinomonadaceae bacterium]